VKGKRGSALLSVIVVSAVLLMMAVFLLKIVYNGHATATLLLKREQAFWLARAGLEATKVKLAHDPDWYTDLPHFPDNDEKWIKQEAVGQKEGLGDGWYKIVRETGKAQFYCMGVKGEAIYFLKGEKK